MAVQALEFIRIVGGLGVGGANPMAVVAVRRTAGVDGQGCILTAGPVGICRPHKGAAAVESLRCKPFGLSVRHGRVCFDRYLRLPATLRNLGLGTWLMACLVRDATAHGLGAARVRSMHLVARDASPLRDNFYHAMGFVVSVWRDGSGWARAAKLSDLRSRANPAKVRPMSVHDVPPDLLRILGAVPA